MSKIKNDLILKALRGETVERPPVWMMRQAGRYLPEYMVLREKYNFFERCRHPELACEITIQPVDIIGVDAAILFSDILVLPQAMGLEVELIESKGPFLPDPIKTMKDFDRIRVPDVNETLQYVFDAIKLTKKELNDRVPLIGFAGAPWTILCYMVQGKGSKTFDEAKAFCYRHPAMAHRLLQMITDTTIAYSKEQAKAGVDVIQIFDSWGGLLSPDDFEDISLAYTRQIINALKKDVLTIIFAKGAWHSLESMAETGTQGLGIDWCITPQMARQLAGDKITLQGNFDPAKLLSPIPVIKKEVKKMLTDFGGQHYIANLGHGILPNTPVDHARAFVETVKEYEISQKSKIKNSSSDFDFLILNFKLMLHKTGTKEIRGEWIEFIYHLQERICRSLEQVDGKALFSEDAWQRAEGKGGGGLTKVIQNGNVFEKGGVNTSVVYGHVTDKMRRHLEIDGAKWFAAGLSLVIHPVNPFVPTIHCNYRMFELYGEDDMLTDRWFGGGTDLTPCYLFEEDAKHFHQIYKNACDEFDPLFYPAFKKECDDYFVNRHRDNERRGIGGIFYDHQRPDKYHDLDFWMNFGKTCGDAFTSAYLPIVEKRKDLSYTEKNKHWQEIRRGRYVEFNLIHDRGTLFGLKTHGRTESILMSLPPTVRFEYDYKPASGSEEEKLLQVCLHPGDWVPPSPKGEL